ncbi:MAG: glycosyltransferase family 2 protein [Acidimicrobiales bacterium]
MALTTSTSIHSQSSRQRSSSPLRHQAPAPKKTPTVSLVVPTLNEAKNLPIVFARIPDCVTEVIVVDGRSTDGTIDVAKSLRPDVKIVLDERKGKGYALASGFAAATQDIIVMIGADGSMAPEEVQLYVDALVNGADFVKDPATCPEAAAKI